MIHRCMDLDIQNYSLEEIVNLFKIPFNFDAGDLKRAKKLVLKSHPDKSNLPSEYFFFYSKAYKILFSIYEFKNKTRMEQTTEYSIIDNTMKEMTMEEKKYLDKYLKQNKLVDENFYKWFNEEFEKRKEKEENGYESWLKSEEDMENVSIKMNEMNDYFEKKKLTMVVKQEVKEFSTGNNNYSNLGGNEEYDADIFSSFYYSDLKQAHSIIPVSSETRQPVSIEEYKKNRIREEIQNKPLNERQSIILLDEKIKNDENISTNRAYYFAKKTQEAERANRDFMTKMKLLK